MWMIEQKRFLTEANQVSAATEALNVARTSNALTLIVGNGPSQSAAWLQNKRIGSGQAVDWGSVVLGAAKKAPKLPADLIHRGQNLLALAQAVLHAADKQQLLSVLEEAFKQPIASTAIDKILTSLNVSNVVTTNYDFQLERAFHLSAPSKWQAIVRHSEEGRAMDNVTRIYKMHGSFAPCAEHRDYYQFAANEHADAHQSIVITESDYDKCYQHLAGLDIEHSSFMRALQDTCLILGKSLDPQDLSFMYALRKTRAARKDAFMLFNRPLTSAEKLHAYNLNINPLVINLPRATQDGHFYFGLVAALTCLFPHLERVFEEEKSVAIADFPELVRGPNVLAIGLASRNITGRTQYNGQNVLPPEGRRNLSYLDVEEHVGGSALTPLMVFAALDADSEHRLAMASAIGNQDDTYGREILWASRKLKIDTDAISQNQRESWHSTVLVHTGQTHRGSYPGQRIFLDRGYPGRVDLAPAELEQLQTQLAHEQLRLIFLDKFLAAQHPPLVEPTVDESRCGPMFREENLEILRTSIVSRPELEVVYETGGGGSPLQHVELRLRPYINVFTAGFPFFASVVLHSLGWSLPESMIRFAPNERWWLADFEEETKAIESILPQLLGCPADELPTQRVWNFTAAPELLDASKKWAGRAAVKGSWRRRWFIATLHHYGALGIDLVSGAGYYCGVPSGLTIENTSGAGDSFRGALMYAMGCSGPRAAEASLPDVLVFCTDVASERCRHFRIEDACKSIRSNYGGRFRPVPTVD